MNYLLNRIENRKKYIEGLSQASESPWNMDDFSLSELKEMINTADGWDDRAKKFYFSFYESVGFLMQVGMPFLKLISYISRHRGSEIFPVIFRNNYSIIPISYPNLYRLLIQLPWDEKEVILNKMNLSMTTLSGALAALENSSERDFVSILEKEPQDLRSICRQLQVYYILYSIYDLLDVNPDLYDENDKNGLYHFYSYLFPYAYKVSSEEEVEALDKMANDGFLNAKYFDEFFQILGSKGIIAIEEKWDEIDNFLYKKNLPPIWFSKLIKRMFVPIFEYIIITFQNIPLSEDELNCWNKVLYENKDFEGFVRLAGRFIERRYRFEEENKLKTDESLDFQIPDDFFSNKAYITESKEDEWIFSIDLDATDNDKKKMQALQKFINKLAGYGYIEDSFHVKATFLYRITGRKLPNTKLEIITWKDEMKNYNCFCYLVKNFEHDFLNRSMGNTKKGLYKKAQRFFGIVDKIDNPSAKANNTQKTKFNTYYEQFKKDMK